MKYLKTFGLAALAAALMAFFAVGAASATVIEKEAGKPLPAGTSITAEAEGITELHPPFGSINCKKSHVGGKTTNAGGIVEGKTVGVKGNIEHLTFAECNATVTPLLVSGGYGSLEIVSNGNGSGTLYGTNQEVTVVYLGFHCIFKTSNTKLGTVTSSTEPKPGEFTDATLDIEATIPRTGGNSGAFCGSTAQWTGSYKVTSPTPLYIT